MKKWCKIIETEKHDVLIQRMSTDEDGEHLTISVKLEGVLAQFKPSFGDDEAFADEAFQKYSKEDAETLVKNTLEMFKG